jgi:FkbM family methyltransferase
MAPMKQRALFSDAFRGAVAEDPLVLVDVGARGGMEEPWRSLPPEVLRVVGFEPDAAECERLNASALAGHRFLPVALWDSEREVEVHVAEVPTCSSVHPPNAELLSVYRSEHASPRETREVVSYPATTLDQALAGQNLACDVLKVDTQGSEGEILRGGAETIRRDVLCALVETWTVPVHSGQALTGDVLSFMADAGLTLFDVSVAAAWQRPLPEGVELDGKRQVTGLDLLFLRASRPAGAETRLLKLAAVADVFGFPDLALQLLAESSSTDARALSRAVIAGARPAAPRSAGILDRVRRRTPSAEPEFAPLHS